MCDMGNLQLLLKAEVGKPLVSLNSLQGTKMRKQNQSPGFEPHFYFLRVGSKNQLSGGCCHPAFSEHCQIRGGECGTSEGSNVLGRCCSCLCWQASWPYPSTSPVLENTSQKGLEEAPWVCITNDGTLFSPLLFPGVSCEECKSCLRKDSSSHSCCEEEGSIHIKCAPVLGYAWLVRLVSAIFNTQSLVLLLQIGFFGAFVLVATRVVPAAVSEARSSVSLVLLSAQAGLQLHVQHLCLGECQDKAGIPWIPL